jgi:hypothetical protein
MALLSGRVKIFDFHGLVKREFADCGADDFFQMCAATHCLAHVVRQRADVGSRGAFDGNSCARTINFYDAKFVHFDFNCFQLHWFFVSREFVGRFALNFFSGKGRRHLSETPSHRRRHFFNFRAN